MTIQLTADVSKLERLLVLQPEIDIADRLSELFSINGKLEVTRSAPELRVTFEPTDLCLDLVPALANGIRTRDFNLDCVNCIDKVAHRN